jgi:hypothetical protein
MAVAATKRTMRPSKTRRSTSSLDSVRFTSLKRYAGEWILDRPYKGWPVDDLGDLPPGGCAVYVVRDAFGHVDYVGSVCRPGNARGAAVRIREHLRNPLKRARWHSVTFLWLRDDTPAETILAIEGAVGADLMPPSTQRLPRLLPIKRR